MSSQITEQELDEKIPSVLKSIILCYLESQIVFHKNKKSDLDLHSVIYEGNEIVPKENKYYITRRISNNITFRVRILFEDNSFVHDIIKHDDVLHVVDSVANDKDFFLQLKETYEVNGLISESNVKKLIEKGFVHDLEYTLDTVLDLTKIDDFLMMMKSYSIYTKFSSIQLNEFSHRSPFGTKHYVGNGGNNVNKKNLNLLFNLKEDRLHLIHTN